MTNTQTVDPNDYDDQACPDCGEPIADRLPIESSCENCGHVFNKVDDAA